MTRERHQVTPPLLAVRDACKRYRGRTVLERVSFDLEPGSWVGLLGPNGAGKTTLLHALAGLIELDRGSIELREAGAIGFVPQEIALYPLLTSRENLRVFGKLHGMRGAALRQRILWALRWTGLELRADEPVRRLSIGMLRRLNIACGVMHRPALVLLDEPTVGVDPQARQRIWIMLEELRADGAAVLQSNHEMAEIQANCERMIVLDRGRVLADGTLEQLTRLAGPIEHELRLTLERPASGLELPPSYAVDGVRIRGRVTDVAVQLPALLEAIRRAGHAVSDVHVESPTLEATFSRLTGAGAAR